MSRPVAVGLAALAIAVSMPVSAQDNGNRMGLGLYRTLTSGSWDPPVGDGGWQAGLHIYFNRESSNLGRIRIEYGEIEAGREFPDGFAWDGSGPPYTKTVYRVVRMHHLTVGYEWLPHLGTHSRSGPFAILGISGTIWNDQRTDTRLGPESPGGERHPESQGDSTFAPTVGVGYRFDTHWALEFRYALAIGNGHVSEGGRELLSLGGAFRF